MANPKDGGGGNGGDPRRAQGWAGVVQALLGLKMEYIAPWALVAAFGAVFYFTFFKAPGFIEARDAASWRLLQEEAERNRESHREEWERNRLFTADRDRQILDAFRSESEKVRASSEAGQKFLFQSIVSLGKQMATLESAVDALRKRLDAKGQDSGGGRELLPMPGAAVTDAAETALRFVLGLGYVLRQYDDAGGDR
jgi:hypothetical protein